VLRSAAAPRILTVTELADRLRATFEAAGTIWVGGEISNLKRPASGHLYFTLKDDRAQIAAVMFRSAAQVLVFQPADGMEVVVRARMDLYPARGAVQLYVEAMEPHGLGALTLAFEQLKARLGAEGLFDQRRKRALPKWPRTVGIVTALHGAAIHDMRTMLRRRWPLAGVVVRPVRVQGPGAARDIVAGIQDLNRLADVDVLIVGRGGGSLEDLWAFNEEPVARAIAASTVPVVSAVGHEVDVTIADFVADARAPTPTAAASLVVPDRDEVAAAVDRAAAALARALRRRTSLARERLAALERGLGDPGRRVTDTAQRLDDLDARLRRALVGRVEWDRRELDGLAGRLARSGPVARLGAATTRVGAAAGRLRFAVAMRVRHARAALERSAVRLDALSPLACLERGYALVRRGDETGHVVTDAATLATGERVTVLFARGRARATIDDTEG